MADKFNVDPGVRPAPNLSPGAGGTGGNPGNVGSGLAQLGDGIASLFAGIQARQQQQAITNINANVARDNIMPDTIDRTGASPDANKTVPVSGPRVTESGAIAENPRTTPVQPLSRQELSDLPPTVQTSMERGGAMTAGFRQGKLQSVNYWHNISTMMRDDIAKNPALAAQIEKAYERQYGFNPAKKYYEEWDKANAQNEANMKDSDKQWRDLKQEASGMGFSVEELRAGDGNPQVRESIQNRVYARRVEVSQKESILKNLEFAEKTGKANEETYFKAAGDMVGLIIQSRFGSVMESVQNTGGPSLAAINKKKAEALADNIVSPQEQQEIQNMMAQFKSVIDQDFNREMNGFIGKLSPSKRAELRKLVDDEYKRLEDDVLTGRTGLLEHNKRMVDLAKQGNAYAVMQQSPTVAAAGALDTINRDAANMFVQGNSGKMLEETSKLRLGVIGQKAAGGAPLGQTITGETQGATPQQKAEVADNAIKSAVSVIKNPNSSPEAVRVMAESLFAKGNMNMLNEHFTPNSRTKVFTALASPAMTQRMVEVGKTNPEALKNYTQWVTNNAQVVMSTKIDDLRNHFSGGASTSSQQKNPLVIGFDGQRFTVSTNPEKARVGASGRIVSSAGLGTAAISTGMRYTIEAVNDINRTLEALEPVMTITGTTKDGQAVNPILENMLGTIGINGAQRSDLQEVARAYQDYKLSQEQVEGVAGKKPSIEPDKTGPVVDNPRQVAPINNEGREPLMWPSLTAPDSELPPSDPTELELTVKPQPQGQGITQGEGESDGYWVPRLQPNGTTVEVFVRKDGTPALNPDGTPMSKEQVGNSQATDTNPSEQPQEATKQGRGVGVPETSKKPVGEAPKPATRQSSTPTPARSNPQGLRTFANAAEANANPMSAGYIIPDDGSYNPGGVAVPAGGGDRNAPVATGGPLDLTSYYRKTMGAESSGNPNAKAKTSSATGLFQFIEGTWKGLMRKYPELGLTPDGRTDPAQQKRAMERFTQDNMASLKKAGLPLTNGTLYLVHFAGDGGAKAILKADANTPIEKILKPQAIEANKFLRGKTAGWVIKWAERKMT